MSLPHSVRSPRLRAVALALTALASASCSGESEAPPEATPATPATDSPTPTDQAPKPYVPPPTFAAEVDPEWFAEPPAERAPIDGIDGFQAISAIEYAVAPGHLHRIDVVHVFPDRARWSISNVAAPDSGFTLDYQYGGHRYRKMPAWPGSTELTGMSLAAGQRQIAVRLAVMMYPHAHEWGPAEERDGTQVRVAGLDGDAGSIRVALGEDDVPTSFTAVNADGQDMETIFIDSWQEIEGRSWPKAMRLEGEGRLIANEVLKDLTTRVNLKDQYFIPVDFKELPKVRRDFDDNPRITALPPMATRSEALPAGSSWEDAVAAEAAAREAWGADGQGFDGFVSFAIDEQGQPLSFFLRLEAGAPPTEGYTSQPQRRAVTLFVRNLDDLTAEHVAALRGALPPGATAQEIFVSWPKGVEQTRVQLVLPFDL